MNVSKFMFSVMIATVVVFSAPSFSADTEAADELMAALKACKADSKAMKSAQSFIKKHGGAPTEDQVDEWVDNLDDDKLFDCLDKKL